MAPDVAFRTLERQRAAANPPANGHEYPALQRLTAAHVDSFNALCEPPAGPSVPSGGGGAGGGLLELAVADIGVKAVFDRKAAASGASRGNKLLMWIEDVQVGRPMVPDRDKHSRNRLIYPAECRERGVSYCGKLMAKVCWSVNDGPVNSDRGPAYTQFGVQIRCVRPDQSSQTVTLHYLSDGQVVFRFSWRKQEYLVPAVLILKSLLAVSDAEICDDILRGEADTWILERVEGLLRAHKGFGVYTRDQCLAYLGDKFRVVLGLPADFKDREIGEALLRKVVLVHLDSRRDKYNLLVCSLRFLSPPVKAIPPGASLTLARDKYIIKTLNKAPGDIGQKLKYFLATGNLVTGTGLDQQQMTGFTIVAEKLNFYRYLAHFRCVHRGAFFATLKTTT
ncbi:MAG: hypothetical protein BJ554DRAFT_7152, partial [Olpidium bornovanus]